MEVLRDGRFYEEIRQQVRDFAEKEIKPIAHKYDMQDKEIPWEIIHRMADLGYFGILVPEKWGGLGLDYMSMAIVAEELSRIWLSCGSVMTRNIIAETLLLNNGTEEQKKKYLPGLAQGKIFAAAAFTEPNAGSDTAGMKLKLKKWKVGGFSTERKHGAHSQTELISWLFSQEQIQIHRKDTWDYLFL
jgi:(2S)-methylsuccinyl-CoA dehydrogenase